MLQFGLRIPRSSWRLLPRRSARHDHIGLATTESGWQNLISTLGFAPSDLAVPNIRAQWPLELWTVPTIQTSCSHRAVPLKRTQQAYQLIDSELSSSRGSCATRLSFVLNRNCREDEGRSLGIALQEGIPNHLKRLRTKSSVVSVKEKALLKASGVD